MKSLKKLVEAAIVALGLAASGCYVQHAPYAYVRIDTPDVDVRPQPQVIYVPSPPPQVYYTPERCITYAGSAADSMDPNGSRLTVCSGGAPGHQFTTGIGYQPGH